MLMLLAACSPGGLFNRATPTPEPPPATPTPAGPQTLNICTGTEPQSLYLYADQSAAANTIRQAIYDGPIDFVNYAPQVVILEGLPNLADNSASIQTVTVQPGDWIVDANGAVTQLLPGIDVRPAGCRNGDCAQAYTGGELQMEQVSATFTLKADLTWSDGSPLTADDSLFSFELNADPASASDTFKAARTAGYTVLDDRTVAWTGLPGYLDPDFQTNFWTPLPRHAWGNHSAAELAAAEDANRNPLGWGAYVIDSWVAGERISLSRNPNYWRAAEGLPDFSTLNFIFTQDGAAGLQNGDCDLVLPSAISDTDTQPLIDLATVNQLQVAYGASGAWEHLDFGVQPLALDNGFNVFVDGADFLSDVRMRQAFAYCLDRQALIEELAYGQGQAPASYAPPEHWLYNADAAQYAYDPAAGSALLQEAGWLQQAEGPRLASGFAGAQDGTPLRVTLTIDDSGYRLAIAEVLANSLDDCGIELEIAGGPAAEIYATGEAAPLFGRQFELAQFSWPISRQPACYLFAAEAVPGADLEIFPYGWGGWNLTGWSNAEFDLACQAASNSLPGEAAHQEQHALAQQIFAEQLPALPLFLPLQLAAARGDFCGFDWAAGANPLQGIEGFGYAEWCQ